MLTTPYTSSPVRNMTASQDSQSLPPAGGFRSEDKFAKPYKLRPELLTLTPFGIEEEVANKHKSRFVTSSSHIGSDVAWMPEQRPRSAPQGAGPRSTALMPAAGGRTKEGLKQHRVLAIAS